MNLSSLNNIPIFTWRTLLMFLSLVLSPGILIVFVFFNDLFLILDFFKLILFAFSLVLPICAINFVMSIIALRFKDYLKSSSEEQVNFFILAIILSSVPLYLVLLTRFLFCISITNAIWELISIEFIYFILSFLTFKSTKE